MPREGSEHRMPELALQKHRLLIILGGSNFVSTEQILHDRVRTAELASGDCCSYTLPDSTACRNAAQSEKEHSPISAVSDIIM